MSENVAIAAEDFPEEIAALVRSLHETQQRLQELAGGEVDAVLHPGGHSYLLHEAQEKLRRSEAAQREFAATQSSILNALPAHIALLDHDGVILSVNKGWGQFVESNSLIESSSGVGLNYLEVCERAVGDCAEEAHETAVGIRAVLSGAAEKFTLDYPCHSPTEQRWFRLKANPIQQAGRPGAVVMHLNITEGKLADEAVRVSEAGMAAAQRIAHLGSWELDLTGTSEIDANALRWSDEMFRLAGYAPGSVKVSNELFFGLIPEDEHHAIREAVAKAIREREPYSIIHRLIRPDGEERILHERAQIFLDEKTGQPLKMIGTAQDVTERKRAEESLAASEVLLRLFIQHTPAAIAMLDRQMRYVQASERWMEDYHLAGQEIIGKSHYEVFPDAPQRWKDIHQRVLAGAVERCEEDAFPRADGSIEWLSWEARPWRKAGGQIGGLIFFTQLITARKQAEADLRFNEQRYRSLVEATTSILWDTPASGEFEVAQPSWSAFTGQTFEEYRGWGWLQAIHPDDQAETARVWTAAWTSRSIYKVEHRLRAHGGTYHDMTVRAVPLLAEDGTIVQWVGIHSDITERKLSEKRIAEQAKLIDEARDAIFLHDLQHRVTFWSKGAERVFGWTAAEAMGRSVLELLHPDPDLFEQALQAVMEKGGWNGEAEKGTKAGATLALESRWTLVRDAVGEPKSILVIDTDVTERKSVQMQLNRAQRMESIGTLAGGIAHDLNNSFGPIIMALDLLEMRFADAPSQELIALISASARHGAAMVRQVLSFARGVEGERVEAQIKHLVREIETIIRDTFPKDIVLRTSVPNGLSTVLADATQLHQVLLNLCVNARDAMPHGGKLLIAAENRVLNAHYAALHLDARPGPYVVLQVEDTGTGMPAAVLEKIYDPFFTTKEFGKGSGLGLSTTLAIVKSHGGFIQGYSEQGKGTRFQVYLPAQTVSAAEVAPETAAEMPRGQGELILVVDDDATVREVTRQTLEAFGYRVTVAADGAEAVATAVQREAELAAVLTDMMMPVMDGPATIRALHKLRPGLPIIAASGLSTESRAATASRLGVSQFLVKPFTSSTLLKALQQALRPEPAPCPAKPAPV